jgi:hypothetical protein
VSRRRRESVPGITATVVANSAIRSDGRDVI